MQFNLIGMVIGGPQTTEMKFSTLDTIQNQKNKKTKNQTNTKNKKQKTKQKHKDDVAAEGIFVFFFVFLFFWFIGFSRAQARLPRALASAPPPLQNMNASWLDFLETRKEE